MAHTTECLPIKSEVITIRQEEFFYPSYNGSARIRALLWLPDEGVRPRGVVQIAHGMAEHIARYKDLASFLVEAGFAVCGNDHLGHGRSVANKDERGVLLPNSKTALIEDVHQLRLLTLKRLAASPDTYSPDAASATSLSTSPDAALPDAAPATSPGASPDAASPLPYFLLGHSMGSFIVRNYLVSHASGLSGAIICGTNQQPAWVSIMGNALARLYGTLRGHKTKSKFLHSLGPGAFARKTPNAQTPLDWLATDPAVVKAYFADDDCGFILSAGGYATITALTGAMIKPASAKAVARDFPLLFIAGSQDPVGAMGKSVEQAATQYKQTGHTQVSLMLYEDMRHEVFNELGKERVYQDVLDWLERSLKKER